MARGIAAFTSDSVALELRGLARDLRRDPLGATRRPVRKVTRMGWVRQLPRVGIASRISFEHLDHIEIHARRRAARVAARFDCGVVNLATVRGFQFFSHAVFLDHRRSHIGCGGRLGLVFESAFGLGQLVRRLVRPARATLADRSGLRHLDARCDHRLGGCGFCGDPVDRRFAAGCLAGAFPEIRQYVAGAIEEAIKGKPAAKARSRMPKPRRTRRSSGTTAPSSKFLKHREKAWPSGRAFLLSLPMNERSMVLTRVTGLLRTLIDGVSKVVHASVLSRENSQMVVSSSKYLTGKTTGQIYFASRRGKPCPSCLPPHRAR